MGSSSQRSLPVVQQLRQNMEAAMLNRRKKLAMFSTAAIAAALVMMGSTPASAATLVANDVKVAQYCTWKYGAASFAFNIDGTWLGWRCNRMSVIYGTNL